MAAPNEDLEEVVTEGQETYVASIVFNEEQKILTVIFERFWDDKEIPYKKIVFLEVENFQEYLFEDIDEAYLDLLLGITVRKEEETTKYFITTPQHELIVSSKIPPIIEKIDCIFS